MGSCASCNKVTVPQFENRKLQSKAKNMPLQSEKAFGLWIPGYTKKQELSSRFDTATDLQDIDLCCILCTQDGISTKVPFLMDPESSSTILQRRKIKKLHSESKHLKKRRSKIILSNDSPFVQTGVKTIKSIDVSTSKLQVC